jgi:hypothetical protein
MGTAEGVGAVEGLGAGGGVGSVEGVGAGGDVGSVEGAGTVEGGSVCAEAVEIINIAANKNIANTAPDTIMLALFISVSFWF